MATLDQQLVDKIKGLRLEFTSCPQPKLLIQIPNQLPEIEREVEHSTEEFTSLCPLNISQPDYAHINIYFIPKKNLVELKSLKMYLASYRMVPIFHEEIPARILKDLLEVLGKDTHLTVTGNFTIRGGLRTTVTAYNIPDRDR